MSEQELHGIVVSPGVVVGPAFIPVDPVVSADTGSPGAALAALRRVVAELGATEQRLAAQGLDTEAEILATNRLMAEDPSLVQEVEALAARLPAAEALQSATERHAAALASLADPLLSARAADVRELGRRAVRALSGDGAAAAPVRPSIVVARELGPAELLDLRLEDGLVLAIALAEGSAASHAAIIARSLGVPMVAALGEDVLGIGDGDEVIVDGTNGIAVLRPEARALAAAHAAAAVDAAEHQRLATGRAQPTVTSSGRCDPVARERQHAVRGRRRAATRRGGSGARAHRARVPGEHRLAERGRALRDARTGSGSTRGPHRHCAHPRFRRATRLRRSSAGRWPRGRSHARARKRAACPVRRIMRAGAENELRIMLPLVESPPQLIVARRLLRRAAASGGHALPQFGAMIETPRGATRSGELALGADFFSIGTNDLVATTLGLDRDQPDDRHSRLRIPRSSRISAARSAPRTRLGFPSRSVGRPQVRPS